MATRSFICKLLPDHSVTGVYCHFDGYPDGVGAILKEHYTDQGKVDELLELGDLSELHENLTLTVAYHRDRGDDRIPNRIYTSIIDAVAERFGFTAVDIRGHKRQRPLSHARHVAMFLVRELITNASYPVIARDFGNRNHTSVISAVDKIRLEMQNDPRLLEEISELRKNLTDGIF